MPDTKLNLQNLKDHLRKYGAVYVVMVVVASVLTSLFWTMTTPVLPDDQRLLIYLADEYSDITPLEPYIAPLLARAQAADPAIQELSFESMMYTDADYTGAMVLMARLAAGEGDMFLAGSAAMAALAQSGACMDLAPFYQDGWLSELEPWYFSYTDAVTGQAVTLLAGVRLDPLDALFEMKSFQNKGACLALPVNSPNTDAAKAVAAALVDLLKEANPDV